MLTRNIEGEAAYHELLDNKVSTLQNLHNYKPFNQIKTETDYGNREYYLYYYAPVLFLAIQKEIGEPLMWKWLKTMVNTTSAQLDYQFLLNTLNKSVADQTLKDKIINKYFSSGNALQNAKDELGVN